MTIRTIVLLVVGTGCSTGALAQGGGSVSHSVTLKRTASTRVSGPHRVPFSLRSVSAEPVQLHVASNIDNLKIVFSLVEPEGPRFFERDSGVDPSVIAVRQIYSVERRIHSAGVAEVDVKQIVNRIPRDFPTPDAVDHRRLVVTVTE